MTEQDLIATGADVSDIWATYHLFWSPGVMYCWAWVRDNYWRHFNKDVVRIPTSSLASFHPDIAPPPGPWSTVPSGLWARLG